uniref:Myb/SANT-like domain-containing protein n=1 Tax=Setaria italica TaxID=4555 RepID=K3ZZK9_SETIT
MAGEVDRAAWNSAYEKGLVEILLDYKDNPKYKCQNGWVSEGWRIITSKFNEKFPVFHLSKKQVQEKEKELKANYKALRDAKRDSVAKFRKKPFPLFYQLEALYEGNLNFTSTMQVDPPSTPAPPALSPLVVPPPAPLVAPVVPPLAPTVERSNFEQCSSHLGANPFVSSFDGQETSSAQNERNEAQDSRREEGGSGRKRKQSHIGSALERYAEYKKSQTNKTLQALEERKRSEEEFSVEKCVDQVDAIVELTDEEKSYALDVFESDTHRKIFITSKNHNVRLIWLKRKIR